ncbi:NAD(+)/NADH kinase [Eubacteriales bacterium KG127]
MKSNKIFIYSNSTNASKETRHKLEEKLLKSGYELSRILDSHVALMIVIGGDGTLLEAIHQFDFPNVPFIGINTGHLGFFQEIMPGQLDDFIFNYEKQGLTIQELSTIEIKIDTGDQIITHTGLNEIAIKGNDNHSIHLNMSIDGSFIQRFSGDGILIASPAGSTAYNYSLGGAIVDPRVEIMQLTPIAPMNTVAYRSFTSSILLPAGLNLGITTDINTDSRDIRIIFDGYSKKFRNIESMEVSMGRKKVKLLRLENYDFWTKVKSKFLL